MNRGRRVPLFAGTHMRVAETLREGRHRVTEKAKEGGALPSISIRVLVLFGARIPPCLCGSVVNKHFSTIPPPYPHSGCASVRKGTFAA
jgi:hypothetical protein